MKIFVVGNINSGKSHVVKQLTEVFPDYQILAIDEYRIAKGDGSLEKEHEIRKMFAHDIICAKDAIIEFSGGQNITRLFIDNLDINSFLVIEVLEDVNVCLQRIKDKDFSKIPYPKFDEKIDQTIIRLDQEFKDNAIDIAFESKYLKKYKVKSSERIEELPLKQYEMTIMIREMFMGGDYRLVAFGSLGRGEMSKTSDVDLFLMTKESVAKVLERLQSQFPVETECAVQKNMIAVYYQDQLAEVKVVDQLEAMQLFYIKSEIKDRTKTILIGDKTFIDSFNSVLDAYKFDFTEEFEYTLARLIYYVKSLNRIRLKGDDYMFFFHNNIVIHEYIRLSYFMHDQRSYAYLPRKALSYIDEETFSKMIYKCGDNQQEHQVRIIEITNRLVKEAGLYLKSIKHKVR